MPRGSSRQVISRRPTQHPQGHYIPDPGSLSHHWFNNIPASQTLARYWSSLMWPCSVMQSQKAVSAYFLRKKLLVTDFWLCSGVDFLSIHALWIPLNELIRFLYALIFLGLERNMSYTNELNWCKVGHYRKHFFTLWIAEERKIQQVDENLDSGGGHTPRIWDYGNRESMHISFVSCQSPKARTRKQTRSHFISNKSSAKLRGGETSKGRQPCCINIR